MVNGDHRALVAASQGRPQHSTCGVTKGLENHLEVDGLNGALCGVTELTSTERRT